MPEVWQMSLAQFVGPWPDREADHAFDEEYHLSNAIRQGCEGWIRSTLRPLGSAPGFYVAEIEGSPGDVALLNHDEDCDEYDVCGGYVGPELWVEFGCRGRGLAAELVLAKAALNDGRLEPEHYNEAGRAAHVSAHRLAVQRALRARYRVPAHAFEGHADLAPAPAGPAMR